MQHFPESKICNPIELKQSCLELLRATCVHLEFSKCQKCCGYYEGIMPPQYLRNGFFFIMNTKQSKLNFTQSTCGETLFSSNDQIINRIVHSARKEYMTLCNNYLLFKKAYHWLSKKDLSSKYLGCGIQLCNPL